MTKVHTRNGSTTTSRHFLVQCIIDKATYPAGCFETMKALPPFRIMRAPITSQFIDSHHCAARHGATSLKLPSSSPTSTTPKGALGPSHKIPYYVPKLLIGLRFPEASWLTQKSSVRA